jgi:perosamine synthetase
MKQIKFCSPDISKKEIKAVIRVLKEGTLSHGANIEIFEDEFADFVDVSYAISFSSWTTAAVSVFKYLQTIEFKEGGKRNEILVPSFSFVASANVIVNAGLIPVFVDINEKDLMVNLNTIKKAITPQTLGIMPVHFAGSPANINEIYNYCRNAKIHMIEDCAEILGIKVDGKHIGTSDIGIFSFYGTKNMTTAEGGMVTTHDAELANWLKIYRGHGIDKSKKVDEQVWERNAIIAGQNYRLSNLQAALGRVQLSRLKKMNMKRKKIAQIYDNFFKQFESIRHNKNNNSSYQMYYIIVPFEIRNRLVSALNQKGIMVSVHFDPPIHMQKAYKENDIQLPITEKISKSIITLPISSRQSFKETKKVCNVFYEIYKEVVP